MHKRCLGWIAALREAESLYKESIVAIEALPSLPLSLSSRVAAVTLQLEVFFSEVD